MLQELFGNNVEGVLALKTPWPSIARSIWGDHKRYLETYMKVPVSMWQSTVIITQTFDFSLTRGSSIPVTAPPVTKTATSGLRVASMVCDS